MPRALRRVLAVVLATGLAVALYASTFLVWNTASARADALCGDFVDDNGTYSVTPTWRGGVIWECEYATVWNPRGTIVLTPADVLEAE